jgi:hypothetical protein
MRSNNRIFIKLDDNIGSIVASESELFDESLIECDGRIIERTDYPELFTSFRCLNEKCKIPDYRNTLKDQMHFYLIARQVGCIKS